MEKLLEHIIDNSDQPLLPDGTEIDLELLQAISVELLSILSAKLWNPRSVSDPGVLIMEVVNSALNELNSMVDLPILSCLNNSGDEFDINDYGFFTPDKIYPTGAVSIKDYRKLFFDNIIGLSNVWFLPVSLKSKVKKDEFFLNGLYDVVLDFAENITPSQMEESLNKAYHLYHKNRCVGEDINKISAIDREFIDITGDVFVYENADHNKVLASVYMAVLNYFSPRISYKNYSNYDNIDLSVLYDGPAPVNGIVDENSLTEFKNEFTAVDLYRIIKDVEGVYSVRNILFKKSDGELVSKLCQKDIFKSYIIIIPKYIQNNHINLYKKNGKVEININSVLVFFYKLRNINKSSGNIKKLQENTKLKNPPKFNSKAYESIQKKFPEIYKLLINFDSSAFSEEQKNKIIQLKGYLLIFDLLISEIYYKFNNLDKFFRIDQESAQFTYPKLNEKMTLWTKLVDEDKFKNVNIVRLNDFISQKLVVIDCLDKLYGEYTRIDPGLDPKLRDKSILDELKRRIGFYQNFPEIGQKKPHGIDISGKNVNLVPGLKKYVACLLGFQQKSESPVTNSFVNYGIEVICKNEFYNDVAKKWKIYFISDEFFSDIAYTRIENIIPINSYPSWKDDFADFKSKFYILQSNVLFEPLLHKGNNLAQYKIAHMTEDSNYLVLFRDMSAKQWIRMGYFKNKQDAIIAVNQLVDFIKYLDKSCETFYLLEHNLLRPYKNEKQNCYKTIIRTNKANKTVYLKFNLLEFLNTHSIDKTFKRKVLNRYINDTDEKLKEIKVFYEPYEKICFESDFMNSKATIIVPNWTVRLHDNEFRNKLIDIIKIRIPAHISTNVIVAGVNEFRKFENHYFQWRRLHNEGIEEQVIKHKKYLMEWLFKHKDLK
ncbi:MAG: hypothetical protein N4A49_14680 [Marinifilaceae bacterium]|jgi:hypothetical protein|nr:hypothetical protein [Marinifilaceae bacterium]